MQRISRGRLLLGVVSRPRHWAGHLSRCRRCVLPGSRKVRGLRSQPCCMGCSGGGRW